MQIWMIIKLYYNHTSAYMMLYFIYILEYKKGRRSKAGSFIHFREDDLKAGQRQEGHKRVCTLLQRAHKGHSLP
jgi:hypothetical protein